MSTPFALIFDQPAIAWKQYMNDGGEISPWSPPPVFFCTCHKVPQRIRFDESYQEWVHVSDVLIGDEEEAMVYHLHASTNARDCDGPHEYYTTTVPAQLTFFEYGAHDRLDVWRKIAALEIPLYGPCKVEIDEDESGRRILTWSQPTDEGYAAGQLAECTDPDCAYDRDYQRDVFAEQMGY